MVNPLPRLLCLILLIATTVVHAAPDGPHVEWLEDEEAVIQRTLRDGTVEQAGPNGKWAIKLPPHWKVVVEIEFSHRTFIKPVVAEANEWTNPHPQNSSTFLNFQNWVRFRGKEPSFSNRYSVQLAENTRRDDLPGALFNLAHKEEVQRHDFLGLKPAQGRYLLLECHKSTANQPDPFFWYKIYLRFFPPGDTI